MKLCLKRKNVRKNAYIVLAGNWNFIEYLSAFWGYKYNLAVKINGKYIDLT